MNIAKPKRVDITDSFHQYFDLVDGDDILSILDEELEPTLEFLRNLPADKHNYRYSSDKWSLKEVVCHLISAEIYFCDLANRITKDQNSNPVNYPLEKYDMKKNAEKLLDEIIMDFNQARGATIEFLRSYDPELFTKVQTINGNKYSPQGIGYIIVGHVIHHLNVIKERYLTDVNIN